MKIAYINLDDCHHLVLLKRDISISTHTVVKGSFCHTLGVYELLRFQKLYYYCACDCQSKVNALACSFEQLN